MLASVEHQVGVDFPRDLARRAIDDVAHAGQPGSLRLRNGQHAVGRVGGQRASNVAELSGEVLVNEDNVHCNVVNRASHLPQWSEAKQ